MVLALSDTVGMQMLFLWNADWLKGNDQVGFIYHLLNAQ